MAATFIIWAADTSALTGPPATVATSAVSGTAKTLLQWKPIVDVKVIEWGYTADSVPGAPVRIELVETAAIAATVTTIGSGIILFSDPNGAAASNFFTAGTSATGFNASAEGSIVASRLLDYQYENGVYFKKQYPLGREPQIKAAQFGRIRATPTSAVAVNLMPYVILEA
jgi:hypothetical protein